MLALGRPASRKVGPLSLRPSDEIADKRINPPPAPASPSFVASRANVISVVVPEGVAPGGMREHMYYLVSVSGRTYLLFTDTAVQCT